jgi:diphosphomevalonate decarboxylase
MKTTVKACSNIAFVKFFGKKDDDLRLPMNSSISMNLSESYSVTTVEFLKNLSRDDIQMESVVLTDKEMGRISTHLDRIRSLGKSTLYAKVLTKNTFPKGSGIASSASGFAALTVSASHALGLNLSEKELTILARLGSGSACRSIPGGLVKWNEGESHETSFAHSLYKSDYWKLKDAVVVVSKAEKATSTTKAHGLACTSPFLSARFQGMKKTMVDCEEALKEKNIEKLGELIEKEALNMHAVMMSATPSLFYFEPGTIEVIKAVWKLRSDGVKAYFTLDAGPTVHVIYEEHDEAEISKALNSLKLMEKIIINSVGEEARIISSHLF